MIRKKLALKGHEYYKTHLNLVNAVLPIKMSNREIGILAEFLRVGGFTTEHRAKVRETLGISPSNLSNYMRSLCKKGFLISFLDEENRRQYKIHDIVKLENGKQDYQFLLLNEDAG